MAKETLTKEGLAQYFSDNFELTKHAIGIAQEQIKGGNEDLNVTQLLEQIRKKEEKKAKEALAEGNE